MKYNTDLKNDRLQAIITRLGEGAYIEICSASYANVLAVLPLANPAGTLSDGVLTFAGTPLTDASANLDGTAAVARIKNAAGTIVIYDLSVGTSGANINLSSTTIAAGQPVYLTSATITHAQ